MAGINTYVRLTERERRIIACISKSFGHNSIAETIRMLIHMGLNSVAPEVRQKCMDGNGSHP